MIAFLRQYPLLIATLLGLAIGVPLAWNRRGRIGLKNIWQLVLLCVVSWGSGFLGMKLIASLENLLLASAVDRRNYGFFFLEPFVLFIVAKILQLDRKALFDAVTIYSIPTLFFGRAVCLFENCCYGKYIFGSQLRWPTREMELIFFLIAFIFFLHLDRKSTIPGQLYPLLMISYGIFRFISEWFRVGDVLILGLHVAHVWMLLIVLIGLSIWFELRSHTMQKMAYSRGNRRT